MRSTLLSLVFVVFALPLHRVGATESGDSLVSGKVDSAPSSTQAAPERRYSAPRRPALPELKPQDTPKPLGHPLAPNASEKLVDSTRKDDWLQSGMDAIEEGRANPVKNVAHGVPSPARGFLQGVDALDGTSRPRADSPAPLRDYVAVWTKDGAQVAGPLGTGAKASTLNTARAQPIPPYDQALLRQPQRPLATVSGANPYLPDSSAQNPVVQTTNSAGKTPGQVAPSPGPTPAPEFEEPGKPLLNDKKYFPQMKRF